MILARYAKKLLAQKELKRLLIFARVVNRDLRSWLQRERRRSAVVEDYGEALALLQYAPPFLLLAGPWSLTPLVAIAPNFRFPTRSRCR